MLKINYVLNHWAPGSSTHFAHVQNLLGVMRTKGCEVTLLIEKAPDGLPVIEGVKVCRLVCRYPIIRHLELMCRLGREIIRGNKTTFVRISASATIVAAICHALLGGRAFLWQSGATHEYDWSRPFGLEKIRWCFRSAAPNLLARSLCQRFVTGPESMVHYYRDVVGVSGDKIRMLYNDINLDVWKTDQGNTKGGYEERFGVARPGRVLLLVHRLSPVRRTPLYIEPLFQRLLEEFGHDWALVIAGDGSEREDLMRMASAAGVGARCHFLGAVPNKDLPGLYSVADVFINPSYAEGFPRVILEAMACGLPIVTTDAGGTADLLGPMQASWVVSRDAPLLFAQKVIDLLADGALQRALSEENVTRVKMFSTDNVARMYMDVLAGA